MRTLMGRSPWCSPVGPARCRNCTTSPPAVAPEPWYKAAKQAGAEAGRALAQAKRAAAVVGGRKRAPRAKGAGAVGGVPASARARARSAGRLRAVAQASRKKTTSCLHALSSWLFQR